MNFAELSAQRYSLRKFSDRPVEDALLQQVLEAGRNAPTAHNNQPQRIFVLQSPEAMAKADACMGCHFHPPVLLAVAYDPAAAWDRECDGKNHGEIDATIAVTQMMLQAADLGLGTTYVGMFDPEKLTAAFPEMAGLVPIAMLPLGYPAEGAHPARLHTDRKPMEQLGNTCKKYPLPLHRKRIFFNSVPAPAAGRRRSRPRRSRCRRAPPPPRKPAAGCCRPRSPRTTHGGHRR